MSHMLLGKSPPATTGARPSSSSPRQATLFLFLVTVTVSLGLVAVEATVLIDVHISQYFSIADQPSAARAPESANAACMDHGGTLIADYSREATQAMVNVCVGAGVGSLCTSFLDGSAAPPSDNQLQCVEGIPGETTRRPSSLPCYYRWRFGFFDAISFSSPEKTSYHMPGTGYYVYLYRFSNGSSQVWNGYTYSPWNRSTALYIGGFPRGFFQTMGGANTESQAYSRMDSPIPAEHNNPNPLSSFHVACSVQVGLIPDRPTSTKTPQPTVVKDKGPWAQHYWWVIFLILAMVSLVALLISLQCCTKCIRERRGRQRVCPNPVEDSIIVRERDGSGYINDGDDCEVDAMSVDEDNKTRKLPESPQIMYGSMQPVGYHQPMAMILHDPTDVPILPRVFSQSDVSITADGDSVADSEIDSDGDDRGDPDDDGGMNNFANYGEEEKEEEQDPNNPVVRRVSQTRLLGQAESSEGRSNDDNTTNGTA